MTSPGTKTNCSVHELVVDTETVGVIAAAVVVAVAVADVIVDANVG